MIVMEWPAAWWTILVAIVAGYIAPQLARLIARVTVNLSHRLRRVGSYSPAGRGHAWSATDPPTSARATRPR